MHRREECRRAVSLDQIQNNGDITLRVGRHLNLHLGISLPIPLSTAEPPHSSMMTVETVPDTEGSPKMASLPQSERRGQRTDASGNGERPSFRSTHKSILMPDPDLSDLRRRRGNQSLVLACDRCLLHNPKTVSIIRLALTEA